MALRTPFAVLPCCVFSQLFPKRFVLAEALKATRSQRLLSTDSAVGLNRESNSTGDSGTSCSLGLNNADQSSLSSTVYETKAPHSSSKQQQSSRKTPSESNPILTMDEFIDYLQVSFSNTCFPFPTSPSSLSLLALPSIYS